MPFQPSTEVFGRQLIELGSATSTNKIAAEMVCAGQVRHGAVILAHEQSAGQGQRGRSWFSVAGQDLTFSIVLLPARLRAEDQFVLSKIAALAVHDVVLASVHGEVKIKWPNDILVERRKIAGILIKNDLVGENVSSTVVGIGINVNNTIFPEDLLATSLALECGYALDRWALLERICERFEARYVSWEKGDDLSAEYAAHLWARGRWAEMLLDGGAMIARPMDVDAAGRMIFECENGEVLACGLERVRFGER